MGFLSSRSLRLGVLCALSLFLSTPIPFLTIVNEAQAAPPQSAKQNKPKKKAAPKKRAKPRASNSATRGVPPQQSGDTPRFNHSCSSGSPNNGELHLHQLDYDYTATDRATSCTHSSHPSARSAAKRGGYSADSRRKWRGNRRGYPSIGVPHGFD